MRKVLKVIGQFVLMGLSAVFLLIFILGILILLDSPRVDVRVINLNWELDLPFGYQTIYEMNSDASFQGDGERYHIFKYREIEKVKKALNFSQTYDENFESDVCLILEGVEVDSTFYPSFQQGNLYFKMIRKSDGVSTIYMILDVKQRLLYVVENIF